MELLGGRVKDIVKEVNAQLLAQIRISEERMLFPKISYDEVIPSGFWSSVKSVYVNVAADYKDADGEAALKSNPTESAAIGRLPIIALKRELNSRLMEDIEELINGGYSDDAVVKKVTEIQRLNIDSVFLRLELDTNRALSNGVIVTNDGTNTNIDNVRVDYLIPEANKYETKVEGDTTLEDVKNVIKDAKSRAIYFELALADSDTLDKLGQAEDMRKAYATKKGISGTLDGHLDLEQINEYFKPKYGFEFVETTPNVRVEIKGVATPKEAWKPGVITFVPTAKPIKIGHKGVIEKRVHFDDGDVYTDLGKYSMMSVLSQKKDPYTIVSRLETRAVPILDAADAVCILSAKKN